MTTMMPRHREREIMDDPALDAQRHRQALQGLARINRWSGSVRTVWSPIQALARQNKARFLRVLDIATGAGDVPIELWQQACRHGLRLHIDGCDRSRTALEYARARAEQAGADVNFFELDAVAGKIPSSYDVIISSLFLHHLDNKDAVHLLRNMTQATGQMVVVNDLTRSVTGLALAYVGTRLLCASDVVRSDGPQSVRAAYTIDEVRTLARLAGLHSATVFPRWPCRFQLTWRRT